jgi:NADPH:quinone reductase-like Zn-dependent oxidoreductase
MTKQTMKAVGLLKYLPIENPESLLDVELEKPKPEGRDLLVKVHAISVNPVDTKVQGEETWSGPHHQSFRSLRPAIESSRVRSS